MDWAEPAQWMSRGSPEGAGKARQKGAADEHIHGKRRVRAHARHPDRPCGADRAGERVRGTGGRSRRPRPRRGRSVDDARARLPEHALQPAQADHRRQRQVAQTRVEVRHRRLPRAGGRPARRRLHALRRHPVPQPPLRARPERPRPQRQGQVGLRPQARAGRQGRGLLRLRQPRVRLRRRQDRLQHARRPHGLRRRRDRQGALEDQAGRDQPRRDHDDGADRRPSEKC